MIYNIQEIKEGIKVHDINNDKFKTNLVSIFLTTPLLKETVTKNSLLVAVLRRGSNAMPTQDQISIELEEMYGADFDCGIEKIGDNQILKFYIESINDEYLPKQEKLGQQVIEKLLEIVFNPLIQEESFIEEFVESEKVNIKQIIETKKDNKSRYALNRCIEEMYRNDPYGLYKYGDIEDLKKINNKNLYNHYKKLIEKCKIDIFISGQSDNEIIKYISKNEHIRKLKSRKAVYIQSSIIENKISKEEQEIEEKMDITQGKLVMGLDILKNDEKTKYIAMVYNAILGGTASSKLFKNVREKESLAYSASSSYIRQKNNIYIQCGIEFEHYEKAKQIIKEQLEEMRQANFDEDEINSAKQYIISTIKSIEEEQDTELIYYLGQELSNSHTSYEEYIKDIQDVKRQEIEKLAKDISINTIYFLRKRDTLIT